MVYLILLFVINSSFFFTLNMDLQGTAYLSITPAYTCQHDFCLPTQYEYSTDCDHVIKDVFGIYPSTTVLFLFHKILCSEENIGRLVSRNIKAYLI